MQRDGDEPDELGMIMIGAAPVPPPDLTARVMATIRAEAHATGREQWRRRRGMGLWWHGVLAALVLVGLVGAGGVVMVHASEGALPGDLLYGVRRARESFVLALAPDAMAHDSLALGFAETYVRDLPRALGRNTGPGVVQGVLQALEGYDRSVSPSHLPWLRHALTSQYQAVQAERRRLERDPRWTHVTDGRRAEQDLTSGLGQIRVLAKRAGAVWAQSGADSPPDGPGADTP